ncbi:MAG: energy-coupling factor transporter ATPase [Clostridia bacterium]|nr:energy-coupling factor transporter ATPase [Clostridia bacterium]
MELVKLQNVKFSYENNTDGEKPVKFAVNDVSLSINEGEFIAIVGHNGSGKSTLARLLNGIVTANEGTVTVNGLDASVEKNLFDIRKTVGVVFQNPDNQAVATIIEDDVAFGPENIGLPSEEIRQRVDWALKSVGMYDYREGTSQRLSGGQKQRVAIAGVLAIKPRVMVLDESTSMLDPQGREEVMKVIRHLNREEKMAVIMITHFMEEAMLADRIIVMNEGKICMEGGKEIFCRQDELTEIGLTVPVVSRIAKKLKIAGLPVDESITDIETLVKKICQ